jgi:hypothetical protein
MTKNVSLILVLMSSAVYERKKGKSIDAFEGTTISIGIINQITVISIY